MIRARSIGSYAVVGAALSVVAITLGSGPAAAAADRPRTAHLASATKTSGTPKTASTARDAGQSSITPPCADAVCTAAGADGQMAIAATIARSADACAGQESDNIAIVLAVESNATGNVVAQGSDTDADCTSTLQVAFDPYTVSNGQYVAVLSGDGAAATSSFTLALPPRTPATPVATAVPGRQVVEVSWTPNTESGVSYAVSDENGVAAQYVTGGTPALDPSDTTKGVAFVVATPGVHTYEIEAVRAGSTVLVASAPSAPVTVAPQSLPATQPPTSSGSGALTGNAQSGQGSVRSGSAPAFRGFAAPSQAEALPALPNGPSQSASTGDAGTSEPTVQGTYSSTLRYPSQSATERAAISQNAASTSSDNEGLVDSLAAALVVILIAGHLGAVARRRREID